MNSRNDLNGLETAFNILNLGKKTRALRLTKLSVVSKCVPREIWFFLAHVEYTLASNKRATFIIQPDCHTYLRQIKIRPYNHRKTP